ncbi:hypothetical protein G9A89_022503 [Geosiphon pyriformis]|nr:hypothetical protein G9A89_022503 [Geosiphon pyriformis]
MESDFFLGVDVGTGSVRAAVVDSKGVIIGLASQPIKTWTPYTDFFEQSSENIWQSVCTSVKEAMQRAGIYGPKIKGIGFDGTCSLVVLDLIGNPISISSENLFQENERNIILWADHRATKQAEKINSTGHSVLNYVGGKISLEMETPKILWLKENMPAERWEEIGHFFDLPDFLTYRATGSLARSTCSLACKCGFVPPDREFSEDQGWHDDFFEAIGLGEFVLDKYYRLGGIPGVSGRMWSAGELVGGLSKQAAKELGLLEGTKVGSAVIDAYAGVIGTLAAPIPNRSILPSEKKKKSSSKTPNKDVQERLAVISGTSSCHLILAPKPIFVKGIWGPYRDVIMPNFWVSEGGQSATGKLIDWIVNSHPFSNEAKKMAQERNLSIYTLLNNHLIALQTRDKVEFPELLVKDLHVYPDFHGNRSPIADASLRGTITGLTIDASLDSLALIYYSVLLSIGFGTREIIESLNNAGHQVTTLLLSGGLCNNSLFVETLANTTLCVVVLPRYIEASVVFGAAICGAMASGVFVEECEDNSDHQDDTKIQRNTLTLWEVMTQMSEAGNVVNPTKNSKEIQFNELKYKVFKMMREDQFKYRKEMNNVFQSK